MPATVTFFHALNYLEGKLITRLAARHRHERTLLPSHTSLVPAGILWRSGACISPSMVAFMEPTTPSQRLPIGEER